MHIVLEMGQRGQKTGKQSGNAEEIIELSSLVRILKARAFFCAPRGKEISRKRHRSGAKESGGRTLCSSFISSTMSEECKRFSEKQKE